MTISRLRTPTILFKRRGVFGQSSRRRHEPLEKAVQHDIKLLGGSEDSRDEALSLDWSAAANVNDESIIVTRPTTATACKDNHLTASAIYRMERSTLWKSGPPGPPSTFHQHAPYQRTKSRLPIPNQQLRRLGISKHTTRRTTTPQNTIFDTSFPGRKTSPKRRA